MKALLGCSLVLACGIACAAEPARAPMEWKSVHPEAIYAWKAANNASDGVVADTAAHSVRFLVEATGLDKSEPVEFFAIGPLSDRAYESMFVTVPSPAAIASALERVGVPRGAPPDITGARLWPAGEKLTLTATLLSTNGPASAPLAFSELLEDVAAKEEGAVLNAPFLYTGGERDASGAVVASTNIPCAVFALYNHAPSLLLLNGQFAQSTTYGRFHAKKAYPTGTLFEMTLRWDGRKSVLHRDITFNVASMKDQLTALRADAESHDLFVIPSFGEGTTVEEAMSISKALSIIDGNGVKVDAPPKGQFFFRAFLPDPAWRERAGRIFQPFEVHVAADGAKTFVFVEEDWSGDGLDPVLTPKTTPFADWKELPGLIAKVGESGAKIKVMFIFTPKATKVSEISPAISAIGSRVLTYYVFGM